MTLTLSIPTWGLINNLLLSYQTFHLTRGLSTPNTPSPDVDVEYVWDTLLILILLSNPSDGSYNPSPIVLKEYR
jgi:hypothetical protein